jgi:2-keto-4-pentenoate hydratase/2-oxohepta-3-ene-1,7-dioic acid hydratase in catechol pathway
MKLFSYMGKAGQEKVGALCESGTLLDLNEAAKQLEGSGNQSFSSMQALIDGGEEALEGAHVLLEAKPEEALVSLGSVQVLSPLPIPTRLRDAAFFIEHMEIISQSMAKLAASKTPDPEAAFEEFKASGKFAIPEVMYRRVLYYNSNQHSVIGTHAPLKWPLDVEVIDYELELAIVIGKGGFDIPSEKMPEHVFGYTLFNDWSARDLQMDVYPSGMGPTLGKEFANSLGPCIVTRDEIPDPHALEMTCKVDDEVWSTGWTKNMHHNIFEGLAQLSRIAPLVAGEVIGTGTPAYGSCLEQGKQLEVGQTIELHMPEIGSLINVIERW